MNPKSQLHSTLQHPSNRNGQIEQAEKSGRTHLHSTLPINWTKLTLAVCFVQQQQGAHSSQAYTKHSPRRTTFWVIKYTSASLKKQKSYSV